MGGNVQTVTDGSPETDKLYVVRGTNQKPVASDALVEALQAIPGLVGHLYVGFPIGGVGANRQPIDVLLLSPEHGVIIFDVVEGTDFSGYTERQDDAATQMIAKLMGYKELVQRRKLTVAVESLTFVVGADASVSALDETDRVATTISLPSHLSALRDPISHEAFERAVSAIQSLNAIRRTRTPRRPSKSDSLGARLKRLEDSIATLDVKQGQAVIETVEGVQRIRGLAGSGKTIVLALKAAYLQAQHPDWRIAVTFNTRSLKGQFKRLINNFTVEQLGEEPDWENLRVVNSWGAPGGPDRDGLYHEFCRENGVEYRDFRSAKNMFGFEKAFSGVCGDALNSAPNPRQVYDVVLIDEAQDLPPEFLRLCYSMLSSPKRLVYAYDELQTLNGEGMQSPESIFGESARGRPLVTLSPEQDLILQKCYRNSRPVLSAAHALGFGIYREAPRGASTGLVQMFSQTSLWTDVGYAPVSGQLRLGHKVELARTEESSPRFLESHSTLDSLVEFKIFDSAQQQNSWVAKAIEQNLREDELRHDDIVVINTDPLTTRQNLSPLRVQLLENGIHTHLAGVDSGPDTFFAEGQASVTFTGVYRAKGNEAGMVYVVNAQECHSSARNLALVRNRLFTAMTRSKAWVRVLGYGPGMEALKAEFDKVVEEEWRLSFRYPTQGELATIAVSNREMSKEEEARVEETKASLAGLIDDLAAGRLYKEDLGPETLEQLQRLIGNGQ